MSISLRSESEPERESGLSRQGLKQNFSLGTTQPGQNTASEIEVSTEDQPGSPHSSRKIIWTIGHSTRSAEELLQLSSTKRIATCAEALWWRCHRSLIADYLKAMGREVVHIADEQRTEIHPYTSAGLLKGSSPTKDCFKPNGRWLSD